MPANTPAWVTTALVERRAQHLWRQVEAAQSPQSVQLTVAGQSYLSFCSNDYLGLANHPALKQAMADAAHTYGVGSGASHLVCGHLDIHQRLEEALAEWLGYERVLLFSTGYMANLALISALGDKQRPILMDKLNHASLIDGARLSEAPFRRYLHNDVTSAAKHMQRLDQAGILATDGIFSMDGDMAPLSDLAKLAQQRDWLMMVDDAHGLGCLGEQGRGCLALCDLDDAQVPLLMGTFGKAFGVAGAFVACSNDLADYLTQFARPFIYTTAMSPAVAATVLRSLELIRSDEGERRRTQLAANIALLKQRAATWPFALMASNSAIQPILIGPSDATLKLSDALAEAGILCKAIRPPTVPPNTARLRITLSADHSLEDVTRLCDTLETIFNQVSK
ncbi:8-amino-7-oxononanoate synthase [Marinomonas ostreistagni]|uniref:8-amino-7-oxononanoate synthase n=1 Tax=Marinomonas ostreistagni TaxID=359209 RepID=UPI001950F7EB|nr:8-amino-7-oxononanoate synthase [Marinomonas ostreistagni]MBM6551234.1 8-amino-7-oxononanoate synthase [Marinomonas ostreistagni]